MVDYIPYRYDENNFFNGKSRHMNAYISKVPKEINPLKETQLNYAPTRREKVVANRRKGFQHKKKTELCKHYIIGEECPKGDSCSFAHGVEELKAKPVANYKTLKCRHFQEKGWCQYGPRCQFLHNEKRSSTIDTKLSYEQVWRIMDDTFQLKEDTNESIECLMDESVNIKTRGLYKLDIFASIRQE